MTNLTYNNLIYLFEQFSINHYQLKQFGSGEIADVSQFLTNKKEFPMMWASLTDVQYAGDNQKQYSFNLLFFDILQNGKENEQEVWSDQLQIAEDFLRFIAHNNEELFQVVNIPQIITFTEGMDNNAEMIAGATLTITLQVFSPLQNDCGIPVEGFNVIFPPYEPSPNPPEFTCQDVKDCLGISDLGSATKVLNEQGDFIEIPSTTFDCEDLLNCEVFTDLQAEVALKLEPGDNVSELVNDAGYLTSADLPSNLIFYPTTAASTIPTYLKLVTSVDDPSYDEPEVNVPTGIISGSNQLIASLVSEAGIVVGQLGIFNVTTVGMIRKTGGGTNANATFYFEIYKRSSGGTETLIATSDNTLPVSSTTFIEFSANALFNDGAFLLTDSVVLKFYGNKVGVGANPSFDFQFGGSTPVRTLFPVQIQALLTDYFNKVTDTTNDITDTTNNRFVTDTQINTWNIGNFGITLDGIGGVISTGSKGYVIAPYACTIVRWDLIGDVSGSIVVDIKRSGTSIIGVGNKPTLSSQVSNGAIASSWTSLTVAQGDVLEFNVDSASTVTRINLSIRVNKI